jgi:hypothetical protein
MLLVERMQLNTPAEYAKLHSLKSSPFATLRIPVDGLTYTTSKTSSSFCRGQCVLLPQPALYHCRHACLLGCLRSGQLRKLQHCHHESSARNESWHVPFLHSVPSRFAEWCQPYVNKELAPSCDVMRALPFIHSFIHPSIHSPTHTHIHTYLHRYITYTHA